ncbi:hypothetical protein F5Y06DRAFT_274123, partial [Hypoxylon sp. FL0890]
METGQHGPKPIPPNQLRPPYDNRVPNEPIYAATVPLQLQRGLPPGDPLRPRVPLYAVAATTTPKRRVKRASLACNSCRQLKAKCDENVPCINCSTRGIHCEYQNVPPKSDDIKVLETLEAILARLSNIEESISSPGLAQSAEEPIARDNVPDCNQYSQGMTTTSPEELSAPYEESGLETPVSVEQAQEVKQENMQEDPAYELSMFSVLEWPSVRKLMPNSSSQVDHASVLPRRDADEAIRPSVASPDSPIHGWSQASTLTPPPSNDWHRGNLSAKQDPRWNPQTVRRYVQSFKDNVLNLYPVIAPTELDDMTTAFLRTEICTGCPPEARTAGQKRKRSFVADERYTSTLIPNHGRPLRTEEDALILLVLALGQLCLRRGEISDVAGDTKTRSRSHFQPTPNSPTSPEEDRNGGIHASVSRQSSFPGGMPDLDYFTLAMGTGQVSGSCQHQHKHVCNHICIHLLAGLFYASLGRLPESWSYVSLASRKIQAVVERSLCRITGSTMDGSYAGESTEDNQLIFDFWICLGLESEIIITLPLPPSGLRQYEGQMPSYPNLKLATDRGAPEHTMQCYAAQLYLRKQLVFVHNPFSCTNREDAIAELQRTLKDSRHMWVPQGSQWKDGDLPPSDAPSAYLRSKYWLLQFVLYLPFLKDVLEKPRPLYAWSSFNSNENKTNLSRISYAELALKALIESTQAFRGLEKHHLIILGLPWTAQTQYENLLVLTACYMNDTLRKFIGQEILRTLFTWAIYSFKIIAYPTNTLRAAMSNLIRLAGDLGFTHGD